MVYIDVSDVLPNRFPNDLQPSAPPMGIAQISYTLEADDQTIVRWLRRLGDVLVRSGPCIEEVDSRPYMMYDFPPNYKLYTRYKRRGSRYRRDSFLFGRTQDKTFIFRSPDEFALHAKWLALGRPYNYQGITRCRCCKCSGRRQAIISRQLANYVDYIF